MTHSVPALSVAPEVCEARIVRYAAGRESLGGYRLRPGSLVWHHSFTIMEIEYPAAADEDKATATATATTATAPVAVGQYVAMVEQDAPAAAAAAADTKDITIELTTIATVDTEEPTATADAIICTPEAEAGAADSDNDDEQAKLLDGAGTADSKTTTKTGAGVSSSKKSGLQGPDSIELQVQYMAGGKKKLYYSDGSGARLVKGMRREYWRIEYGQRSRVWMTRLEEPSAEYAAALTWKTTPVPRTMAKLPKKHGLFFDLRYNNCHHYSMRANRFLASKRVDPPREWYKIWQYFQTTPMVVTDAASS